MDFEVKKLKLRTNMHGLRNDDWSTPKYVLDEIKDEFGEFFDPCPLKANFCGLSIDWKNINYINPPYSKKLKEAFIHKAFKESKKEKTCIMLLPVSTETKIFHEIISPNAEIRLIRERINFIGYNSKNEFVKTKAGQTGSMLVIFGKKYAPKIITHDFKRNHERRIAT